ncbi:MAG: DUF1127 domain-containing protein [Gammaproteobacteria bacterium]|nr:DUF1127 domain-containing protein [Gammaproteobacteria bacterium]
MTIKLFQQIIESLKFRHECKKSIQILMHLDDHALQDIGINRSDIESVVKNQLRLKYCMQQPRPKKVMAKRVVNVHRTLATTSH